MPNKKEYYKRKWKDEQIEKRNRSMIALSKEDMILVYNHLAKLKVNPSRLDWIETKMYELRQKANKYEKKCITVLGKLKQKFIHQAPFVIDGKIYFADFFLPDLNIILEIDGYSHNNYTQKVYDRERDYGFGLYRIKTIRISNELVSKDKIKEILSLSA